MSGRFRLDMIIGTNMAVSISWRVLFVRARTIRAQDVGVP